MQFRKDIQVLRGLAVLFVVLFHLQVPGFAAGYLGVDIFFVISGYLMGKMYDPAKKTEFFGKRAARLLPAYFAAILGTMIAAAIVTRPDDFSKVAEQALFGAFFTSNIGFWMENSYFDKSSFKPLLHLWSLGVEIQFYLLVPLVFYFTRKFRASGLAFIIAVSAVLCFFVLGFTPGLAFYLLPFRLWEFLGGFAVALSRYAGGDVLRHSTVPGTLALAAIVALPLLGPDGSAPNFLHGHPGLAALIACSASVTLLITGLPAWILANPVIDVLERLGTYSYSVYLAHFPVIVLFLYEPFGGTILHPKGAFAWIGVLFTIAVCSALLFTLVEQPFRQRGRALRFSLAAAAGTIVAIPFAVQVQASHFPVQERVVYDAWFDRGKFRCGRFYSVLHRGDISCDLTPGLQNARQRVLLVGNSHADAIKGTFLSVAQARNTAVRFVVQNTVLMEGGRVGPQELAGEAIAKRVNAVVLHYSPGAVRVQTVEELVRLLAPHGIAVAYLLPVPVWQQSVPKMLINHLRAGVPLPVVSLAAQDRKDRQFETAMRAIPAPALKIYRTAPAFCTPICQLLGKDGRPYYFDDAHLTVSGSERLRPVFEHLFDDFPENGQVARGPQ